MKQVAGDLEGQAVVAMLNVEEAGDVAMQYGVRGIPSILVLKNGKVVDQIHSRDRASILRGFRAAFD